MPFPPQHKYLLSRPDGTLILPLLNTKHVFPRGVLAELLWFISSATSTDAFITQGLYTWEQHGSRAHLDAIGLPHRAEDDLGPMYGFQWRHFGAAYADADVNYAGQGIDQLAKVLRQLRESPRDRRIVLSAWNPADTPLMALPPCHMFAQFYVAFPGARAAADAATAGGSEGDSASNPAPPPPSGVLHALLYQHSCDMSRSGPFNIALYALLTHMLARCADLTPGSLTHTMGDAHVYADQVKRLREQLGRAPRAFPTLKLRREAGCEIDRWAVGDFVVRGYEPPFYY